MERHPLNRPIDNDHVVALANEMKDPLKLTEVGHQGRCIAIKDYPTGKLGTISKEAGIRFSVVSGNHRIQAAKIAGLTSWSMVVYHPGKFFINGLLNENTQCFILLALYYVHAHILKVWMTTLNAPPSLTLTASFNERFGSALMMIHQHYDHKYLGDDYLIPNIDAAKSNINKLHIPSTLIPLLQYPKVVEALLPLVTTLTTISDFDVIKGVKPIVERPIIPTVSLPVFYLIPPQSDHILSLASHSAF
jgi:hypothetical protein